MSNHFHLMAHTPLGNLDNFLRHFLTETARALQRKSNRINHIFGGRSNQSILSDPYSVAYVYKYIFRNPVRAGICPGVERYPYSSLTRLLKGDGLIPITDGIGGLWSSVPKRIETRIDWLNLPTPKELETLISNGLKRSSFAFSKANYVRRDLLMLARCYGIHAEDDPLLKGL